jgi:hypothetical protein
LEYVIRQNNGYVELLLKFAFVPAISDRGQPPPLVFRQAEDEVFYATSTQNRYNEEVHQKLHGEDNKSSLYDEIEIQTFVATYLFPPRLSPENIKLKESIVGCTKKEPFRTVLLQGYINEDWENFARPFAIIEFALYLCFVILITIQFW